MEEENGRQHQAVVRRLRVWTRDGTNTAKAFGLENMADLAASSLIPGCAADKFQERAIVTERCLQVFLGTTTSGLVQVSGYLSGKGSMPILEMEIESM